MKARITAKDGGPMDSELSFGHRRIRKATRLALGACLLVLLAPPRPALAADVVVAGGVLSFSNANGELNDVTVSVAGGDLTPSTTPPAGCPREAVAASSTRTASPVPPPA